MSTPLRLNELSCPTCKQTKWIMDSDYRGRGGDGVMIPYADRPYFCPVCWHYGRGWTLIQQAPTEFLLQPHDLYPMTHADFEHWVTVLRRHFPKHRRLGQLGCDFYPRTPEEALKKLEEDSRGNSEWALTARNYLKDFRAKYGLGEPE